MLAAYFRLELADASKEETLRSKLKSSRKPRARDPQRVDLSDCHPRRRYLVLFGDYFLLGRFLKRPLKVLSIAYALHLILWLEAATVHLIEGLL